MKRHETPSSAGSTAPQSRRSPFGRIRLTILLATVAAFMLVPAAQAFAALGQATFFIEGTGSGKVFAYEEDPFPGNPPVECSYASPGPATGICETELSGEEEFQALSFEGLAAPGSELAGWEVTGATIDQCASLEEEHGFPPSVCGVAAFEGEPTIEITAYFTSAAPTFPLTVTTEGTGEGTVTSTPAGIDCGSECEAEFEEGEEVELSQSPETGSEFIEWGGACSGTGTCKVTMSEAKEVKATFNLEPEEFALEISTDGSGEGEVSCEVESGPAEPCEAQYLEGTEVALVPEAETGSEFSGWSEDCTGTGACELTMDEAHSVTATFDLESETLTAEVEGPGSVSAPEDIDCPGVCAGAYNFGEEVTLTATPDSGAELLEWSGSGVGTCAGTSTSTCEVGMTADKTVKAIFALEPAPEFNLTIVKAGTGSGSVTCDGGACAAEYPEGTEVTLAATAASGSTFAGWSGAGCSGTASCKVTINADTTVTATFTADPKEEAKKEEPKPTPEGTAKAAASAPVKSGKASLKLSCSGGPCKGTIQLKAKVKQGKKTKNLVIGKASFSIADGASATLKVKLSGPAKQELTKGKTLKAKTSGAGVSTSTVKLKQAKK